MIGFTEEEIYWKSLQFAVPAVQKPSCEKGVDYKLTFLLAVLSFSFISVLSKRLWALFEPLPVTIRQITPTVTLDPSTDLILRLLNVLCRRDIKEISKYLNAVRVELEYVCENGIDRMEKLERIINICNGTDREIRMGTKTLEIKELFVRLNDAIKVFEDIEKHKLKNNNMLRLDIYLLLNSIPEFMTILDNAKCIFNTIGSFRSQLHDGKKFVKKECATFDEMIRDIKQIVCDLETEKNDFQKRFTNKMNRSFLKFAKEFKLPNSVAKRGI